jgi:vesicle-associated membrane protein 7
MAIVYALVARGTVVLAEFAAVSGNAGAVARRILEKLPAADAEPRLCFAQDRYIFHVLRSPAADGLTFLCMANDTFGSQFLCPLIQSLLLTLSCPT